MAPTTAAGGWGGEEGDLFCFFAKKNAISSLLTAAVQKYWCYYPHRSTDSVSPICRIFLVHYRHVTCTGTLWVGTSHPVKTKIALVNVKGKLPFFQIHQI